MISVHTHQVTDAEDQAHREAFDDEFRFLRWVQDPDGQWFCVEGIKSLGVSGPVTLAALGSPIVQRLLDVVNKGLVRVQRASHEHEGFDVKVSRVVGRREDVVLDECFDVAAKGQARARTLVTQIATGAFSPKP